MGAAENIIDVCDFRKLRRNPD